MQRREGGFDGRRPTSRAAAKTEAAASKQEHKQQEKQPAEQHKHTNNNPESEGQEVWVPTKGGRRGRRPVAFRLCSRLFFWMPEKFAIIGH